MICGVSGSGGRLVEAKEGLVLASQHGLHVGKELVAEFGTIDVRAEPGQLVAAPPPTCDETLACHGGTRIMLVNAPPTGSPKQRRPPFILYSAIFGGVLRCPLAAVVTNRRT
jgi:hypothetical protein